MAKKKPDTSFNFGANNGTTRKRAAGKPKKAPGSSFVPGTRWNGGGDPSYAKA